MSISTFHGLQHRLPRPRGRAAQIDITGHNISNANTEGYTRQQAILAASPALAATRSSGMIAARPARQRRRRHRLPPRSATSSTTTRCAASSASRPARASRRTRCSGVELTLPEPGDNGLQSIMTKFWNALQRRRLEPRQRAVPGQSLVQQSADDGRRPSTPPPSDLVDAAQRRRRAGELGGRPDQLDRDPDRRR